MPPVNPLSEPLSDEDLDRLEELLDDDALHEALRLDEIQGYLCAALAGPGPIPDDDRLVDILGSEDALDSEAGRAAAEIIERMAEALEAEMAAGQPPTLLVYDKENESGEPGEPGDSDYASWCLAYLTAVDASPEDWFEFLGDEQNTGDPDTDERIRDEIAYLDERLFPLLVLTGEAEEAAREHGEEWPDGEELEALQGECADDLAQAVTDIYLFWAAKRGVDPIRRDQKIGRNEPCPCGSGKKFKQCCGAQ